MEEKLNVVLITFSGTGNTKYVADRIGYALEGSGHHVFHLDAIALVKALGLGNEENMTLPIEDPKIYSDAKTLIEQADVVGFGTYSNAGHLSPGLSELLEFFLPVAIFAKMKFWFTYATAGWNHGWLSNSIATILSKKNTSAVFAGSGEFCAPENAPGAMPVLPQIDVWVAPEKAKVEVFASELLQVLEKKKIPSATFKNVNPKRKWLPAKMAALMAGDVVVDQTKCKQCQRCAKVCPYNAISFDIEDACFPSWNSSKCRRCFRCYHNCSQGAIQFPQSHSGDRPRFTKAVVIEPGEKTKEGWVGIPQPFGWPLFKRMLVSLPRQLRITALAILTVIILIFAFLIK